MDNAFKFVPINLYGNNKNREKPVIAVYKDGRMCLFPSARDAARLMKIPSSNIVSCLKGRIRTAGGCSWKYADDYCGERRTDG